MLAITLMGIALSIGIVGITTSTQQIVSADKPNFCYTWDDGEGSGEHEACYTERKLCSNDVDNDANAISRCHKEGS